MTPRSLVFIAALLAATPAFAQDSKGRQRDPGAAAAQSGGASEAGPREAARRSEPIRRETPAAPAPAPTAPAQPRQAPAPPTAATAPAPIRSAQAPDPGRAAQQPQRVPDGDRQAIPRPPYQRPPNTGGDRNHDGYRSPGYPRVYNNYYYYPRHSYPYGYGTFGLGYFYYNPYVWGPTYGYYDPYYGGSYYGGPSYGGYATGELRLDVRPRSAEVYVDGYFVGRVDDFDGAFQAARIEEGPHRIRIVAPGFEPLDIDVRIFAGRKITYRGDLLPRRP
jgi:hypothetical protein